jgi:hypothetical protein
LGFSGNPLSFTLSFIILPSSCWEGALDRADQEEVDQKVELNNIVPLWAGDGLPIN